MKNFLAVFLGSAALLEAWRAMEEEERKEKEAVGVKAWTQWVADNKDAIVYMGSPLGKTKRITKTGVSDTRNEMGAFTVVQAESHDETAKMFIDHPHFIHFPGESVELMECLPMPEM